MPRALTIVLLFCLLFAVPSRGGAQTSADSALYNVALHVQAGQKYVKQDDVQAALEEFTAAHQWLSAVSMQQVTLSREVFDVEEVAVILYSYLSWFHSQMGDSAQSLAFARCGAGWLRQSGNRKDLLENTYLLAKVFRDVGDTLSAEALMAGTYGEKKPSLPKLPMDEVPQADVPVPPADTPQVAADTILVPVRTPVPSVQLHIPDMVIWLTAALVFFLLAALVYALRQHRFRRRQTREADRQAARSYLEGQEQERQRLARELHDGVSNQLLAVQMRLNADGQSSRQAMQLLSESREQVRRVSHQLMPPEFQHANLREVLSHYLAELDGTGGCHVSLVAQPADANWKAVDAKVALEVYRIVQEAVGNALKHAGASTVAVGLRLAEGLECTVSDDGQSLPANTPQSGIGVRTMQQRADTIGATLVFQQTAFGHVVRLCLPPPEK